MQRAGPGRGKASHVVFRSRNLGAKPECTAEHDEMIRRWFAYLEAHHDDMFPEWKSARYFREVDRHTGQPTGRYIMTFEYHSHQGFLAYKERRKDWSGPYAEYKTVDPYRFFDLETVTEAYWEPHEEHLWLDFGDEP